MLGWICTAALSESEYRRRRARRKSFATRSMRRSLLRAPLSEEENFSRGMEATKSTMNQWERYLEEAGKAV